MDWKNENTGRRVPARTLQNSAAAAGDSVCWESFVTSCFWFFLLLWLGQKRLYFTAGPPRTVSLLQELLNHFQEVQEPRGGAREADSAACDLRRR